METDRERHLYIMMNSVIMSCQLEMQMFDSTVWSVGVYIKILGLDRG